MLRPGGRFYATAVGQTHMWELKDLLERFASHSADTWNERPVIPFVLDNGADQLSPWFSEVTLRRYEDGLVVTEAAPLIAYVQSMTSRPASLDDKWLGFREFVERELAAHGVIRITKDSGILEATRQDARVAGGGCRMKSKPDCLHCSVKQALSAARAAGVDEVRQLEAVRAAVAAMRDFSLDFTPAHNSTLALRAAHEALGNDDPFAAQKRRYNELALRMYPRLKALLAAAEDRLEAAVKVAVAGNVIDLGLLGNLSGHDVDIEGTVADVFSQGLTINDLPALRAALHSARGVLYLGDNAGEIVFDKVLVEEIAATGAAVVFAVKEKPILNDATAEDARAVGMDEVARVISTGSGEIGVPLAACSAAFRQEFAAADLIISKGQGNFESLDDVPAPVFFMLKAKCEVTAAALGVTMGEMVLLRSRAWAEKRSGKRGEKGQGGVSAQAPRGFL